MSICQLDLFNSTFEKYKITKPIRLIELFAGIGSQAKALKNLGANFEHYKVVEFDKHAMASYNAIHGTNFTTQDITQTHAQDLEIRERESYTYILTYSFPCQDLSLAGKQKGMKKGEGTRSGLLWEVERILDECKGDLPQVLLMENVPQVHSKVNNRDFLNWQNKLSFLGYTNYWQDLNAKDYGIPQNRNRCFMISLLGDYAYIFPDKQELKLKLKDLLEDDVDEKYYLSDKMISYISTNNEKWSGNNNESLISKSIASTINTGEGQRRCDASNYISNDVNENYNIKNKVSRLGNKALEETLEKNETLNDYGFIDGYNRNIRDDELSGTITTRVSSSNQTFLYEKEIPIKTNNKKGYIMAHDGDGIYTNVSTKRGTVQTLKTQIEVGVVVDETRKN